MTRTRLAQAFLVVVGATILVGCAPDSTRPMTGPPSASTTELPHPESYSQITVLNPGQWPPQLRLQAGSWADFGWAAVNVRSQMYWGPVANCGDDAPQRRFGQQSDGSYALTQAPPYPVAATVTVYPPPSEVSGSRIKAYMITLHDFWEGAPGASNAVEDTTSQTVCLDAPTPPPPPPLNASISGPSSITPDGYCSWYGSVSGGTPPYSLAWTRNGEEVSTSSSYTAGTPGGYFWLQFAVTDAYGRTANGSLSVAEDADAAQCPW